jgi:hypothetical protein
MPISTFPRHDYDEEEYLLKPAGLRDTHSEGKVTTEQNCYGQCFRFEGEWAQKWAQFEELADFWLLSTALNCWFYWLLR